MGHISAVGRLPTTAGFTPLLATHTASMFAGFHLRIVSGELSAFERTHGAQRAEYRSHLSRG
jgi:hypothetical protein